MAGADGLGAGGLEGVGGPVVLAGLPDDRVPVVLAAVMDGDADAEGQGGLALVDVVVADGVVAVDGDAEAGVEPVEGLLGGALRVAVPQLVGQVGVIDLVQAAEIAANADGDLVDRLAGELVTAAAGRGLQVGLQVGLAVEAVVVLVG